MKTGLVLLGFSGSAAIGKFVYSSARFFPFIAFRHLIYIVDNGVQESLVKTSFWLCLTFSHGSPS